jgi:DNA-binding NarL/FixJ family response regulator
MGDVSYSGSAPGPNPLMPAKPKTSKPSKTQRSRVFLVEDHPIVRHGIRMLLGSQPDLEVCGEAGESGQALQMIAEARPDLTLLDVSIEGRNGIELIKEIKSLGVCEKTLVSSMHDELLYAERALRAGAMGYVQKSEGTERLLEAVRHVLAGRIYISPRVSSRLFRISLGNGHDTPATDPLSLLSDRELAVFELIGQGLTVRQIAQQLSLSRKTIETYREHLREKLGLVNSHQLFREAVLWVHQQGDGVPPPPAERQNGSRLSAPQLTGQTSGVA